MATVTEEGGVMKAAVCGLGEDCVQRAVGALEKEPPAKCYEKTVGEEATFLEAARDYFTQLKDKPARRLKVVAPVSVHAGSMDLVVVPDSEGKEDDMCECKHCGRVHSMKDIEECHRVCREQSRCSRCGLIHKDYELSVWIIDGFDTFDCELYIPNLHELQMKGETIILPTMSNRGSMNSAQGCKN